MMNQIAVYPAVTIYKGMDKYKAKCNNCSGGYGIKGIILFQFLIGRN
jgi:hypothetical protein